METKQIISELKSVADPERKEAYKTMFPTAMEYLGVRTPAMRELLKKMVVRDKRMASGRINRFF